MEKNSRRRQHSVNDAELSWLYHVVVLQGTAKKCTKIYNARAQLLFCSLNLLFGGVLVAIVAVVCLSSLLLQSFARCFQAVTGRITGCFNTWGYTVS